MSIDIPKTSDLVLTSLYNRELIDRHPDAYIDVEKRYTSSQEPIYGLRVPTRSVSANDELRLGAMVDLAFRESFYD